MLKRKPAFFFKYPDGFRRRREGIAVKEKDNSMRSPTKEVPGILNSSMPHFLLERTRKSDNICGNTTNRVTVFEFVNTA